MRDFAEAEIIIPNGPYQGRRFRADRQPFMVLWFDSIDEAQSAGWNRFVVTGPSQSGKTLGCFVIPVLYHLFEIQEDVIVGLPDLDMAADKWKKDLLPVIQRTKYASLLPNNGAGAKGSAKLRAVHFENGATLRFMSAGGGDKSRAGYTSRVVVITETDGMDKAAETSREADPIKQLEARTRAYGARKRVYMECTLTTEQGRTWQEYTAGTESRIVVRCPHCEKWTAPGRGDLHGWQDCENEVDAAAKAYFACPECEHLLTVDERREANAGSVLLHRGQTIDGGEVIGDAPRTSTFGFRWGGFNNLFVEPGDFGADEWKASRATDEENAEMEMCQFVWAVPYQPPKLDEQPLSSEAIVKRVSGYAKGFVPDETMVLTVGLDIGKYLCHYTAIAWQEEARGLVVDYGRFEVASDQMGTERALLIALREFRDMANAGWSQRTGEPMTPARVFVDAGYQTQVIQQFCREAGRRFLPCFGRGASQQQTQWYYRPKTTGAVVKQIGEGFHISWDKSSQTHNVEVNSDYWKTWLHRRLATPTKGSDGKIPPGAMLLYQAMPRDHLSFSKHLTAERQIQEYKPGQGDFVVWERMRRTNHWLDSTYLACAAGALEGVRLEPQQIKRTTPQSASDARRIKTPDGRPFVATER